MLWFNNKTNFVVNFSFAFRLCVRAKMSNIQRLLRIIKIMYKLSTMYEMYMEASKRLKRRWWVRPANLTRNEFGFHGTCFQQLKLEDEENFFKATRMSVPKFQTLLTLIKERLARFSRRAPINEETRLALTLIYLSKGCSPQYLAWSHKIGVSKVREIIYDTCNALSMNGKKYQTGTETTFQYYFVGDNAFPPKHNLMRPYPGRNLSAIKDNFNKKLSRARVHIENSFGILASRCRVLHTNIHAAPNNLDKIVLATIVLHNYLMLDRESGYLNDELVENGVQVPGTWRESHAWLLSCRIAQANRSCADAFRSSDTLSDILFNN
ncbi:uncharacterized protein LOC118749742 [Rhagoletis pomonella]|uniref:uncharacterized protein LOC118749742 n=1 Tax=Rhagoletis pomonella TaxID=28610 RepID=UPI00177CEE48|nr:uncharacterized protein LOC118749742 [Rhagoletis pomonella]